MAPATNLNIRTSSSISRILTHEPLGHRLIQVHPLAVFENSHLTERGSQIVVVENPHMRKVANDRLEVRQRASSLPTIRGRPLRSLIPSIPPSIPRILVRTVL